MLARSLLRQCMQPPRHTPMPRPSAQSYPPTHGHPHANMTLSLSRSAGARGGAPGTPLATHRPCAHAGRGRLPLSGSLPLSSLCSGPGSSARALAQPASDGTLGARHLHGLGERVLWIPRAQTLPGGCWVEMDGARILCVFPRRPSKPATSRTGIFPPPTPPSSSIHPSHAWLAEQPRISPILSIPQEGTIVNSCAVRKPVFHLTPPNPPKSLVNPPSTPSSPRSSRQPRAKCSHHSSSSSRSSRE
jgi:hypothetical protein